MIVLAWASMVVLAGKSLDQKRPQSAESSYDPDQMIPLTVEKAGDQYLCYHSKTMAFVCQGSDLDEIKTRFKNRYPDKNAAIVNGDDDAVAFLIGQLRHNVLD